MPSLTSDSPQASVKAEWQEWAARLRHWGLSQLAAALIESSGPFGLLAAQSLYVSEPLLTTWMPRRSLRSLAGLLESREQGAAFAQLLRETK